MAELDVMKQALDILKKDVEKYQQLKVNLEADIHALNIQKENAGKIEAINNRNKLFDEETRLKAKEDQIKAHQEDLDRKEVSFKDRSHSLERRELEVADLSLKKAELIKERSNFNIYKFNVERELEKANIIIAEANQKEEELKIREANLKGREKNIVMLEKKWNDDIGKLEQDKKAFEILSQNKEAVK